MSAPCQAGISCQTREDWPRERWCDVCLLRAERDELRAEIERLRTTPHTCPPCAGTGRVSRPPHVAGDVPTWSASNQAAWECRACGGTGIVWPPCAKVERLRAALRDLLASGVEHDDPRIGYVTMQVDRVTLNAARAALGEEKETT